MRDNGRVWFLYGLGLSPEDLGTLKGEGWSRRLYDIVAAGAQAQREVMATDLKALLDGPEPAPEKAGD